MQKDSTWEEGGWWGGWGLGGTKKGLMSYILQYKYFIHCVFFALVRYDNVFESKQAKWIQDNWSIFEKSSA